MRLALLLLLSASLIACPGVDDDDATVNDDDAADDDDAANDDDSGDDDDASPPPLAFPPTSIWYQDVSSAPTHADSDAVVAWMAQDGNSFEPNNEFRMTLGFNIFSTDDPATLRDFTPTDDFFVGSCDPGRVPVPPGGSLEDEVDYACSSDGDCHLLVHYRPANLLYEMWRGDIPGGSHDGAEFFGGCMAVWDLERDYGWNTASGLDHDAMGRGVDCTSADAAGYPISPLVFTPEELAAGEIAHALRFVLPNRNIREDIYVAPATHSTPATSGPATAPPYGAHFRLKPQAALEATHSDVDFGALSPGAQVIVTALQTYGMFLSDGGNIALTGASDLHSDIKYCDHDRFTWCDDDPDRLLHEHDLKFLRITDFEMLDHGGPERTWTGDCTLLYSYDDQALTVTEN